MDIKGKVILAPMAGITDYAFRSVCREFGADLCVSEMVSAKAMHYEDMKTASLAHIRSDDMPISVQIFGHEPEIMREAAYLLSNGAYKHRKNDTPPDLIDINMGCPVKKIVSAGDGSALLKDPKLCERIISETVKGSSVPVTVKIRAGWDKNSINCVEIARIAEASGASAITVHARTRAQMYEPSANWEYIRQVKEAVKIDVIGNGDIFCASDALRMIEETGADAVMVGRGAMGNPFIFDEIKSLLNKKTYTPPSVKERLAVAWKQIERLIEDKGERIGVCESRKHLAWYTKGLRFSAQCRGKINKAETKEELWSIVSELISAEAERIGENK
ncbi:MAG: tRNA dihydrouridine synthase DusB [Clostridia bacterium]|nr:tRNA dihydrouridine synthase DusB [Clostridia bacterium]